MKLVADVHISPRTVAFLRRLGHDVARVGTDYLRATAADIDIVAAAIADERSIVTQDVDFSAIVALSNATRPSVVLLGAPGSRAQAADHVKHTRSPPAASQGATRPYVAFEGAGRENHRWPATANGRTGSNRVSSPGPC